MQNQIIYKLHKILEQGINNEAEAVYVLSRVRKLWESLNRPTNYDKLIFYCDWTLHTEICNTGRVKSELEQFINDTFKNEIVDFRHFRNELTVFLDEQNLPKSIVEDEEKFNNFRKILIGIYSDTPLYIRDGINKKITFKESAYTTKNQSYSVSFSIEEIFDKQRDNNKKIN